MNYRLITREMIEDLIKQAAAAPKKRARITLHASHADGAQEMVIALHRFSYVRPHRHPKPESYHVLEGALAAMLYDDSGALMEALRLDRDSPIYRLDAGVFHAPRAITEWVVYHEVYPGPWEKSIDVFYAPWSREEDKP